jgi:hypothetical protein
MNHSDESFEFLLVNIHASSATIAYHVGFVLITRLFWLMSLVI